MIDYHAKAFKPDICRRTYLNLMTREGVMGGKEFLKGTAHPGDAGAQRDCSAFHPHAGRPDMDYSHRAPSTLAPPLQLKNFCGAIV